MWRKQTLPPSRLLKSLDPFYGVKEGGSYFAECPRDDSGHCKPSGQGDDKKPDEAAKPEKKPEGKPTTKPKRAAPGSQMEEKTREELRGLGMVGTFPPAEVPMTNVKIADTSQGADALKYTALMSWDQKTASGRISRQYRYTQDFHDRNAAAKCDRVMAIEPFVEQIENSLKEQMADKKVDERKREAAAIASVIRETGLRPTDGDDSVKHGHFGISSLQARHLKVKGDKIEADFIGKEGVRNQTTISDPTNVAFLKNALAGKGAKDFIFAKANSDDAGAILKEASKAVGGPDDIKIKDLRTLKATQTARSVAAATPAPQLTGDKTKDAKAIAKSILDMSGQVAKVLNNTPTQARDNYIHPEIFKQWQSKLTPPSSAKPSATRRT